MGVLVDRIPCLILWRWPGLTVARVDTLLQEAPYTALGHLHKIKQGIRSTKTPMVPHDEPNKKTKNKIKLV
jgi:hypothetical protein